MTEESSAEVGQTEALKKEEAPPKIKTRQGSGYLRQLYSTARVTANSTHSHLKNLTSFLVNFVPIAKVEASSLQVRVHFDDAEIQSLAESIKTHGVLQPILVVQDGDHYQVIAGERRLRAAQKAGLERIPARVLSTQDKATHEIALRENLDRVDLHPIEEGEGYLSLLEAKAYASHEAIAQAFGKPKSRITECIGLTRLPSETKMGLLKNGIKNRSLLRHLLTLTPEVQLQLLQEVLQKQADSLSSDPLPSSSGSPSDSAILASADKRGLKKETLPSKRKPFTFRVHARGVNASRFQWKKSENPALLKNYIDSLKKLLLELEALNHNT